MHPAVPHRDRGSGRCVRRQRERPGASPPIHRPACAGSRWSTGAAVLLIAHPSSDRLGEWHRL